MSSIKKSGRSRHQKKKEKLYLTKGQSFIPIIHEGQEEFLRIRGKETINPEMEIILAAEASSKKHKKVNMKLGVNSPLPWEIVLTVPEVKSLKEARSRTFKCQNKKCRQHNQIADIEYMHIVHTKPPHKSKSGEEYGHARICHHVGVKCKTCNRLIKYIKSNKTNRRLAKDPWLYRDEVPDKRKGKRERR